MVDQLNSLGVVLIRIDVRLARADHELTGLKNSDDASGYFHRSCWILENERLEVAEGIKGNPRKKIEN